MTVPLVLMTVPLVLMTVPLPAMTVPLAFSIVPLAATVPLEATTVPLAVTRVAPLLSLELPPPLLTAPLPLLPPIALTRPPHAAKVTSATPRGDHRRRLRANGMGASMAPKSGKRACNIDAFFAPRSSERSATNVRSLRDCVACGDAKLSQPRLERRGGPGSQPCFCWRFVVGPAIAQGLEQEASYEGALLDQGSRRACRSLRRLRIARWFVKRYRRVSSGFGERQQRVCEWRRRRVDSGG